MPAVPQPPAFRLPRRPLIALLPVMIGLPGAPLAAQSVNDFRLPPGGGLRPLRLDEGPRIISPLAARELAPTASGSDITRNGSRASLQSNAISAQ